MTATQSNRGKLGRVGEQALYIDALPRGRVGMWAVDVGDGAMQRTDVELEANSEPRR